MTQADWARELARTLLATALPRRWAHTHGVARQARGLAAMLGQDSDLVEAAAWLHDIGYAPDLAITGFHPLDGARYLRDVHNCDDLLCRLVAHHSCAAIEAEERGLAALLLAEFPPPRSDLFDALAYCDMTTTPSGDKTSVRERIQEICSRYGANHLVTRFIGRATPQLTDAVAAVENRKALADY
jgi:putative nucleotidyltransferase with HDIG domain